MHVVNGDTWWLQIYRTVRNQKQSETFGVAYRLPPNVSLYGVCRARNEFELIPTIKMETRRPVEIYFSHEYAAICSHCGVMTVWSRKTWKFCEQFLCLFGRTIPLKLSLLRGSRTDSARAIPTFGSHCSRLHPNRFTFGGVIAERVKTVFAP